MVENLGFVPKFFAVVGRSRGAFASGTSQELGVRSDARFVGRENPAGRSDIGGSVGTLRLTRVRHRFQHPQVQAIGKVVVHVAGIRIRLREASAGENHAFIAARIRGASAPIRLYDGVPAGIAPVELVHCRRHARAAVRSLLNPQAIPIVDERVSSVE